MALSRIERWVAHVVAARATMLTRVGPVPPPPTEDALLEEERAAIEAAAAALLRWERCQPATVDRCTCGLGDAAGKVA